MTWTRPRAGSPPDLSERALWARGRVAGVMALVGALALVGPAPVARGDEDLKLIPLPVSVEQCDGSFTLDAGTAIRAGEGARPVAERLHRELEGLTGLTLSLGSAGPPAGRTIRLELDDAEGSLPEGYHLEVRSDEVLLRAPDRAGLFYATRTLHQLLSPVFTGLLKIQNFGGQ